ncbi:MAG: hypothetical protein PF450_03595 [Bacteroidales bacterium]|nr:hypothetical protein [Bacteroidales bacterium]
MDNQNNEDILRTEIRSLYALHLGLAFDEMREAEDLVKDTSSRNNWFKASRLSLSSILHSFCSLEALLNYLGYRRFFYPTAPEYILPEKRDYLLKRFLGSWDNIRATEKVSALLWSYSNNVLPQNIEGRLIELNNLRNWIAHGKTYHTISLIEQHPDIPHGYYIHDEEDSVEWLKKFPRCKFKEPHLIDYKDAQIALRIIIELFLHISKHTAHNWFFITFYPTTCSHGLYGNLQVNIDDFFGQPKTESGSRGF